MTDELCKVSSTNMQVRQKRNWKKQATQRGQYQSGIISIQVTRIHVYNLELPMTLAEATIILIITHRWQSQQLKGLNDHRVIISKKSSA